MVPPETMIAAVIRATGGPERIEIARLPVPTPGPRQVLVRFEASEVNHVDALIRAGGYRTAMAIPFVIGRDLVGTVVDRGAQVDRLAVGDRVWCNSLGHDGRAGSYAELVAIDVERVYPLPDGVAPEDAAIVLHGAGTAWIGLVREAGLRPGETVVVGGAAGAVGSAAVQLAAGMGARVIAVARPRDADWCRESGAEVVVDASSAERVERIRAAAPDGVDVWWETNGRLGLETCLPLLRRGGRVLVTADPGGPLALPVGALYRDDACLLGFVISNASVDDLASAALAINRLLAAGRLHGRRGASYRLADAAAAHAALESGEVRGRILITP